MKAKTILIIGFLTVLFIAGCAKQNPYLNYGTQNQYPQPQQRGAQIQNNPQPAAYGCGVAAPEGNSLPDLGESLESL